MDYEFDEPEPESELVSDIDEDASYVCDFCGEDIVVPLDFSQGKNQKYVEDCPVCCNPNLIFVELEEDGHVRVWSRPEQDRN